MNFVGHTHFARRKGDAPRLLLGAMLPDWMPMAGTRLIAQDEPAIAAGVADHHAVDDVFHAAPTFVSLQTFAIERLSSRGMGWGASRAVAHVAPELFLDGLLLEDDANVEPYVEAVREAGRAETLRAMRFSEGGAEHFLALHRRLSSYGPPHGYRDAKFVGDILVRILSRRPRLAIRPEEIPALDAVLPLVLLEVEKHASTLLSEVRAGLSP